MTEYADRKMVEGYPRRSAYVLAAKRMFWPVTASIATTLAAFLPLMFLAGHVPGKFMRYLPVTVFTVLTGSLLYALVFGPVLGTLFGKAGSRDAASMDTLKQLEEGDPRTLKSITGLYARLLSFATRYAAVTLGLTLIVLYATFAAYGTYGAGFTFFSDSEPKFANVSVRARGNLSVERDQRTREGSRGARSRGRGHPEHQQQYRSARASIQGRRHGSYWLHESRAAGRKSA